VLGTQLYGRTGGMLAMLLLLVTPLDFAWSTMLASDIILSALLALFMVFVVGALRSSGRAARIRWTLAGVVFWLAFHAKLSAMTVLPAVAIVLWLNRRALGREALALPVTAGLLLLATGAWGLAFSGDPLVPLHQELAAQGLSGPKAYAEHAASAETFRIYPRLLALPNNLGNLVFGLLPQLTLVLLLVAPVLGLRTSPLAVLWFVCLFLGLELNVQHADGGWVAGFRNVRHAHVLVFPLILTFTGLLLTLRRRLPRTAAALAVIAVAVGAWQSVSTASKTQASFADRRQATAFLATLPGGDVYGDLQLQLNFFLADLPDPRWWVKSVHLFDRAKQKAELDAVTDAYVVTGGGREPYYGCYDCFPLAAQLTPGHWQLLLELPGPATPTRWRREPLRVWRTTRNTTNPSAAQPAIEASLSGVPRDTGSAQLMGAVLTRGGTVVAVRSDDGSSIVEITIPRARYQELAAALTQLGRWSAPDFPRDGDPLRILVRVAD